MSPNIAVKFMPEIGRIITFVTRSCEGRIMQEGVFFFCQKNLASWWLQFCAFPSANKGVQHISKKSKMLKVTGSQSLMVGWWPSYWQKQCDVQNTARWFGFMFASCDQPVFFLVGAGIVILGGSDYAQLWGNEGKLGIKGREAQCPRLLWLQPAQTFPAPLLHRCNSW